MLLGPLLWAMVGVPLAGAVAVLLLRGRAASGWAAMATAGLALALALLLLAFLALAFPSPWAAGADAAGNGLLRADAVAVHVAVALAWAGLLAVWLARPEGAHAAQALAVLGVLEVSVLAQSPVLAWAGLEATVLGLLLGGRRGGEATWRATVAVVPALGLALLGVVLMGGLRPWTGVADGGASASPLLLSFGWMLLLAGLAPVAGLAPLHGWMRAAGRGHPAAAALLPALAVAALVLLARARGVVMAQDDAVEPGPPLVALGMASLAWAALGLWRAERPDLARDALLFPGGLAAVAIGLGGDALGAGLVLLTASVVLGPVVVLAAGRPRALALAALALLPPFATFGAAVALLGEAADGLPWLAVPLGGLMVAGSGGLVRAALVAWRTGGPARSKRGLMPALPVWLVLAAAVAAGAIPAAGRWMAQLAEGLR